MRANSILNYFLKGRFVYFVCIIIYRLISDIIYLQILVPIYGAIYKYGNWKSAELEVVSWLILIAFAVLTFKYYSSGKGVSSSVIVILFLLQLVPFSSMVSFGCFPIDYILAYIIFYCALYICMMLFEHVRLKRKWGLKIEGVQKLSQRNYIKIVTICCAVVVLYMCAVYSHFRISFSLDNVYNIRDEASAYGAPAILNYLYGWCAWINPFLIGYYIRRKNVKLVVFLSILQIFMYGYNGMKGNFFFAIVVVLMNLFIPKIKRNILNVMCLYGITGLNILILLVNKISGSYTLAQLFTNRLGYLTNQIAYAYYEFFTTHVPDYFRSSFLRHLGIQSPYTNMNHMISLWFFGIDEGANNGLIADAMANYGIPGIVILPIIIAVTFKIFDSYTNGLDSRLAIPAALYLTILLISNFYTQILLSGGLIIVIFVLKWANRDLSECEKRKL